MLSSTADHLYWMARSIERAENAARMLDVTYNMSLLQRTGVDPFNEWRAMLSISGLHVDFETRYPEPSAENVLYFMALDAQNPGSIYQSIFKARENARAVRRTITSEMWETLNSTWLEAREKTFEQLFNAGTGMFHTAVFDAALLCGWFWARTSQSPGIGSTTLTVTASFLAFFSSIWNVAS